MKTHLQLRHIALIATTIHAGVSWMPKLLAALILFVGALQSASATEYFVNLKIVGPTANAFAIAFDAVDGGDFATNIVITNFSTDGQIASHHSSGGVTGSIDNQLILPDGVFFSEYVQDLLMTTRVSFNVNTTSFGAASTTPPDTFAIYIQHSSTGLPLVSTTEPLGTDALFVLSLSPTEETLSNYLDLTGMTTWEVSSVPEPSIFSLMPFGLLLILWCVSGLRLKRAFRISFPIIVLFATSAHASDNPKSNNELDVTQALSIVQSGYLFNRKTGTFDQTLSFSPTITRIFGPLRFEFINLRPDISVGNLSGRTSTNDPYIATSLPGNGLAFEQKAIIAVKFKVGSSIPINYNLKVFSLSTTAPEVGALVSFTTPALPVPPYSAAPVNPVTGRNYVMANEEGTLEYDPKIKDPITALAQCTGWIAQCVRPGVRTVDDCARSVPNCTTTTPWLETASCCPSECFTRYSANRIQGIKPLDAMLKVYFRSGSCIPSFLGVK